MFFVITNRVANTVAYIHDMVGHTLQTRYHIGENRWSLIYHQLFIHIQEYSNKFKSLRKMRTAMAIFMNAIICIIYILGISLINRSFPIAHPNIAYGLTIIALAGILFVTQILLLLLLLSLGKNKFSFLIPLIVPCVYGLSILDAYPRRSFAFLSFLFV